MLSAWLLAFALTQLIECPVWLWGMARDGGPARRWLRFEAAFSVSTLTHPFVWFVFPQTVDVLARYTQQSAAACWDMQLVASETFAWVVEGWMMHRFGLQRAWAWSFVANGLSLGLGMVIG
jgi:hypothetical protein